MMNVELRDHATRRFDECSPVRDVAEISIEREKGANTRSFIMRRIGELGARYPHSSSPGRIEWLSSRRLTEDCVSCPRVGYQWRWRQV